MFTESVLVLSKFAHNRSSSRMSNTINFIKKMPWAGFSLYINITLNPGVCGTRDFNNTQGEAHFRSWKANFIRHHSPHVFYVCNGWQGQDIVSSTSLHEHFTIGFSFEVALKMEQNQQWSWVAPLLLPVVPRGWNLTIIPVLSLYYAKLENRLISLNTTCNIKKWNHTESNLKIHLLPQIFFAFVIQRC